MFERIKAVLLSRRQKEKFLYFCKGGREKTRAKKKRRKDRNQRVSVIRGGSQWKGEQKFSCFKWPEDFLEQNHRCHIFNSKLYCYCCYFLYFCNTISSTSLQIFSKFYNFANILSKWVVYRNYGRD